MIGVDLFAGAGGLSLGAKLAGIRVVFAVEKEPHAAATYCDNHPECLLFKGDIRRLAEIAVRKEDELTILFGGPPCQGFSTSNQRTRNTKNANNWMFREFVRLARKWRPDWIVFENVKGITETEKGRFLHLVTKSFESLEYRVSWRILNAVDFGVPQNRSRIFVVGSRRGLEWKFDASKQKKVTVRDAIDDLPELCNGASVEVLGYRKAAGSDYARALRGGHEKTSGHLVTRSAKHILRRYGHIPPGGNWENIPRRLMSNYSNLDRCHTGIYYRLVLDEPSVVIGNYRKNMLIHPSQDRGLSVREAARLQSFPDGYNFKGSIGLRDSPLSRPIFSYF
ncbi:MAG: DNA cytosine methyltransferase [Limisphaerales bacterium]